MRILKKIESRESNFFIMDIEVKQYFLRELKEQGIIKIIWRSGDEMTSDIFTKNLPPSWTQVIWSG
jgi:hypothetical protein